MTLAEQSTVHNKLLAALSRHCCCEDNLAGALTRACAGHAALAERDHGFEHHMMYGREIASRLIAEEFMERTAA